MPVEEMRQEDVPDVTRLLNILHPDEPGAVDPRQVRQGWKAFVARDESDAVVGFLLGTFVDYGMDHESSGTLEQLVVDDSARARGIGRDLVEAWKTWLLAERVPLGFLSVAPEAIGFYQACGFRLCTGPYMVWSADADAISDRAVT